MRMTRQRAEALRARRLAQQTTDLGCHYHSDRAGGHMSAHCRGGMIHIVEPGRPDRPTDEICPRCNTVNCIIEARARMITDPPDRWDEITTQDSWERFITALLKLNRPATLIGLGRIGPFQTFGCGHGLKYGPVEWPWPIEEISYRELVGAVGSGPIKRSDCGYRHPQDKAKTCQGGLVMTEGREDIRLAGPVRPCPNCRTEDFLLFTLREMSEAFDTGSKVSWLKETWVEAVCQAYDANPVASRSSLKRIGAFNMTHDIPGLDTLEWPWLLTEHNLSAHAALSLQAILEDIDKSSPQDLQTIARRMVIRPVPAET